MKALIVAIGLVLILGTGALWLHAQSHGAPAPGTERLLPSPLGTASAILPSSSVAFQIQTTSTPTIGTPVATPNIIAVGTSTTVDITVQITDPSLIPGSVNLLRTNTTGTQPTILGVMQNVGNSVYSLQRMFNETTTGEIQLEVSAAFRGMLRRIISTITVINIWEPYSNTTMGVRFLIPNNMVVNPVSDSIGATVYVSDATEEFPGGGITIRKSTQTLAMILDQISRTLVLMSSSMQIYSGQPWVINTYLDPTSNQQFIDAFSVLNGSVYQVSGKTSISVTNLLPDVLSTFAFQ